MSLAELLAMENCERTKLRIFAQLLHSLPCYANKHEDSTGNISQVLADRAD